MRHQSTGTGHHWFLGLLRNPQGRPRGHVDRLDATLDNRLPHKDEHTSIHWHGIRLPNDQDGVPYLVQPPVEPGESFRYSFVPPDTGTFFFHTHCNTSEQLGRGLVGILIVDGDTTTPYAADEVVLLRDWRIDLDGGTFSSFTTARGANRAGTYGNVRSANGATQSEIALPASADCRLRVINADPTRIMDIAVDGADISLSGDEKGRGNWEFAGEPAPDAGPATD